MICYVVFNDFDCLAFIQITAKIFAEVRARTVLYIHHSAPSLLKKTEAPEEFPPTLVARNILSASSKTKNCILLNGKLLLLGV